MNNSDSWVTKSYTAFSLKLKMFLKQPIFFFHDNLGWNNLKILQNNPETTFGNLTS